MSNTTWYEFRAFQLFHEDSPVEVWSPIAGEDDKLRRFLAKQGWEADPLCKDDGGNVYVRRPFELVPQVSDEVVMLQGQVQYILDQLASLQESITRHDARPKEQSYHKTRRAVDSVEDAISERIGGNVAWELTVKGGVEWK